MHLHPHEYHDLESPAEVGERRRNLARQKYPRRDMKRAYQKALTSACWQSSLSLQQAEWFMSYLLGEISDQLLAYKMVRIPRLGVFGIVPIDGPNKFRVHYCADAALRLRVHQELYQVSEESLATYHRICRGMSCAVPRYVERGSSWMSLMELDRRRALRQPTRQVHISDLEEFF